MLKKIVIVAVWLFAAVLHADLWWAESYKDALSQAKAEHKIVLLMFSSPTCGVCHYMKSEVFEDDRIFDYVEKHFVPVDVDVRKHPDKYGFEVYGTPTFYFLDGTGKWVAEPKIGGAKPDAFLRQLKAIVAKAKGKGE